MATEPNGSKYPQAVDDDTSLLTPIGNRRLFRLAAGLPVDGLEIVVNRGITGVPMPSYLIFEGGEVVYATQIKSTIQTNDTFVLASIDDRGQMGMKIQPHQKDERIFVGYLARHHNQLKQAILAAEKYQGFTGLDGSKPAYPEPGMRYTATDTGRIYYCFVANEWAWVNDFRHNSKTYDLAKDDHKNIYHNDARADAWHLTQSGTHILDGDDHDHVADGEGDPVRCIISGLDASRPATCQNGQVYFSTDLDGGTLWIGLGTTWQKVSGVPTGGIMAFAGGCPTGWSRFTGLDGRIPRGVVLAADMGKTGGDTSHYHLYTQNISHTHSATGVTVTTSNPGDHQHNIVYADGDSSTHHGLDDYCLNWTNPVATSSAAGAHTHTCTTPTVTSSNPTGGVDSAVTDTTSGVLPPSRDVVWCKKG